MVKVKSPCTRWVKVHRNLHRKCWSIKEGNRVTDWLDSIVLSNCEFRVGLKARERVLREHKRNVHAYVKGNVTCSVPDGVWKRVRYNPYTAPYFFIEETGEKISRAEIVKFSDDGHAYAYGICE